MTQPQSIGSPQKQQAQHAGWSGAASPFAAAASGLDSQQPPRDPASHLLLHRLLHGEAASSQPEVMAPAGESAHGTSQTTINCSEHKTADSARALSQVSVSSSCQHPAMAHTPGLATASKVGSGSDAGTETNGHGNSTRYMQHIPNLLSFLSSVAGDAAHHREGGAAVDGHYSMDPTDRAGAPTSDTQRPPHHHHHNPGLPEYLDEISGRCSSPATSLFSGHSNSSEASYGTALAPTMTSTHTSNPASSKPTSNPSGTGPTTPSATGNHPAGPPAGTALQHHLQQLHQIQQAMHSGSRMGGEASSRVVGSLGEGMGMGGDRGALSGPAVSSAGQLQPPTPQQYQQYQGAPRSSAPHVGLQGPDNLLQQLLMSSTDMDIAAVLAGAGPGGATGV
jgi:hypothetical protein